MGDEQKETEGGESHHFPHVSISQNVFQILTNSDNRDKE